MSDERDSRDAEPEDLEVMPEDADQVKGGITSPRDPASGQATGKRVHKPFGYIGETEKNLG
jgi:hypothetical protein